MAHPHPPGAPKPVAPIAHQEAERRPTRAQASVLDSTELKYMPGTSHSRWPIAVPKELFEEIFNYDQDRPQHRTGTVGRIITTGGVCLHARKKWPNRRIGPRSGQPGTPRALRSPPMAIAESLHLLPSTPFQNSSGEYPLKSQPSTLLGRVRAPRRNPNCDVLGIGRGDCCWAS